VRKQFDISWLRRLNAKGWAAMDEISVKFDALADELNRINGADQNPREESLTLSELEVACFYAMKAAGHNPAYKSS